MAVRGMIASLAIAMLASGAKAVSLYAVAVAGTLHGSPITGLYQMDPATGVNSRITYLPQDRIFYDITGRSGDHSGIYTLSRQSGPGFVNYVSRMDVASGAVSDLYSFTAADLGYASPYYLELGGITFDPFDSSRATVLGVVTLGFTPSFFLFDLDLDTGSVSELRDLSLPVGQYSVASDVTYAPNGALFAVHHSVEFGYQVGTIDVASGLLSPLDACPPATCDLRTIEFDPTTGALYGADKNGNLLLLSPDTGAILETLGPTGLPQPGAVGGVKGLAFVTNPEPATGALLAIGLAILAARRRRRCR